MWRAALANRSLVLWLAGIALTLYLWPGATPVHGAFGPDPADGGVDPFGEQGCPRPSTPLQFSAEIAGFVDNTGSRGVHWVTDSLTPAGSIRLTYEGGNFTNAGVLARVGSFACGASLDADEDGFPDFVAAVDGKDKLVLMQNRTGSPSQEMCSSTYDPDGGSAEPYGECDSDALYRQYDPVNKRYSPELGPTTVRRPKFVEALTPILDRTTLDNSSVPNQGERPEDCFMVAGDFDGDHHQDFAVVMTARGVYANPNDVDGEGVAKTLPAWTPIPLNHVYNSADSPPAEPEDRNLRDVAALNGTEMVAVGEASSSMSGGSSTTIYHFNGSAWTSNYNYSTPTDLKRVWGTSLTDYYTLADTEIRHFDGNSFNVVESDSVGNAFNGSGSLGYINDIWGSGTRIYAVGNSGEIGSSPGGELPFSAGSYNSANPKNLLALHGTSDNDIWAVGEAGTILHCAGSCDSASSWDAVASNTAENLRDVYAVSPTAVFAVGTNGTVLFYNGTTWADVEQNALHLHLDSVWAASATEAIAVGQNGRALVLRSGRWVEVNTGLGSPLHGVAALSSTHIYVVGDHGKLASGSTLVSLLPDGDMATVRESRLYFGDGTGTFTEAPGGSYVNGTWTSLLDSGLNNALLQRLGSPGDRMISGKDVDVDGDGWTDVLLATSGSDLNRDGLPDTPGDPYHPNNGLILLLRNACPDLYSSSAPQPCSIKPRFEPRVWYAPHCNNNQAPVGGRCPASIDEPQNIGPGLTAGPAGGPTGISALAYADMTGDGYKDLVIAGAGSPSMYMFKGINGWPSVDFVTPPTEILTPGYSTVMRAGDIDLDGRKDLILGTGGGARLGKNWPDPPSNEGPCRLVDVGGVIESVCAVNDTDPPVLVAVSSASRPAGRYHDGYTYLYSNNTTSSPFTQGWRTGANYGGSLTYPGMVPCGNPDYCSIKDLSSSLLFDYDLDPEKTNDVLLFGGKGARSFFPFPNRVSPNYNHVGEIVSDLIDISSYTDAGILISAVKLTPKTYLPGDGSSVDYFARAKETDGWTQATYCDPNGGMACSGGACVDTEPRCVNLAPGNDGRDLRWMARITPRQPGPGAQTPALQEMKVEFIYTEAEDHFRAGIVVDNGVAYLGGFRQPGNQGKFWTANAGLTEAYVEFGPVLDALGDDFWLQRRIWTWIGPGMPTPIELSSAFADDFYLKAWMGAADATEVSQLITWIRSKRFGINQPPFQYLSRLGAIQNSTPAIIGPPPDPVWLQYAESAQPAEAAAFTSYKQTYAARKTMALVGDMSGMIHGIAVNIGGGAVTSLVESWAFVPNSVLVSMKSDRTRPYAANYVDGPPAVADVLFADGSVHLVTVVPQGLGGSGVMALDITNTADSSGTMADIPRPLWERPTAFGAPSTSKCVIARIKPTGTTRFAAICGSGSTADIDNWYMTNGQVFAVDVETGSRLWAFMTQCPLSSSIVTFETDSATNPGEIGSTGHPATDHIGKDGYVDRVVFADSCGNVYKVHTNLQTDGGWNQFDNGSGTPDPDGGSPTARSGLGVIDTGITTATTVGYGGMPSAAIPIHALFSTAWTPGALGHGAPISGTIGAAPDSTGRIILYFGTGGLTFWPSNSRNEFYAVYADTGEIRDKVAGECTPAGTTDRCEKYYGGTVVTANQVWLSASYDPVQDGTAVCDFGTSRILGYGRDALDLPDYDIALASATLSALTSSTGGSAHAGLGAGALYVTLLNGAVAKVGNPAIENPTEAIPDTTMYQPQFLQFVKFGFWVNAGTDEE